MSKELIFRALRADEVELRVKQIYQKNGKPTGLYLLCYKNARCDQNILDETVGPLNWQRHHLRDNANCIIAIWDDEKKQWVEKEDTGTESNTEAEKGLASDSFKRAGFNWGIGRELYTSPKIFISAENCNIKETGKTDRNGSPIFACYDNFTVGEMTVSESKVITRLTVLLKGREVFAFGDKPGENPLICNDCGQPIKGVKKRDGTIWYPADIAQYSKAAFHRQLCVSCLKKAQKQEPPKEDSVTF